MMPFLTWSQSEDDRMREQFYRNYRSFIDKELKAKRQGDWFIIKPELGKDGLKAISEFTTQY